MSFTLPLFLYVALAVCLYGYPYIPTPLFVESFPMPKQKEKPEFIKIRLYSTWLELDFLCIHNFLSLIYGFAFLNKLFINLRDHFESGPWSLPCKICG